MAKLDVFKYSVTIEDKGKTRVMDLTVLFEKDDNNTEVIQKSIELLDESIIQQDSRERVPQRQME